LTAIDRRETIAGMTHSPIFGPVIGQAFLTILIWCWMYYVRIGIILRARIDPQKLENEAFAQKALEKGRHSSDNLENLFEVPVVFFAAAFTIHALGVTDDTYVGLAWGFVALRTAHSLVHCTFNHINTRFATYLTSSCLVWAMWARLGWQYFGA
jgi:hypothetical protein